MSVRDYYYAHFDQLTPDKQFHFATRIKNYFKTHVFDDYLAHNIPSQDLAKILADNDYTGVNRLAERRPYFEKYDHVFAVEATLFRINHLLNEYNIDKRHDFLKLVPLEQLYALADALEADDGTILTLSSWAVNVICLTELWFPRGRNVVHALAEKVLALDAHMPNPDSLTSDPNTHAPNLDPLLLIYLYTHIILCDVDFYVRPPENPDVDRQMLNRVAEILHQHYDALSLDVKNEFLVCAKLLGVQYPELKARIANECRENLSTGILTDPRRPAHAQTLNGAEHRNVLFIMSGLDAELSQAPAQK